MQQHSSNYFAHRIPCSPPLALGMGSIDQDSTFLEHSYVAYQIRKNRECSNMVANILGMGSIAHNSTFSEHGHVACQIKGNKEIQQNGSKYSTRRPPDPHDPRGWDQKVKFQLFQNMVIMHIKLNAIAKCSNM